MLLSKTAIITWNPRNKKHYIELGYKYAGMNTELNVSVDDLTKGSKAIVQYCCDYCGKELHTTFEVYNRNRKITPIDSCSSIGCQAKKARQSLIVKYGTYHWSEVESIMQKRKATNRLRYGAENPFASDIIKKKIKATNIEKYGCEYTMQNKEIQEKAKKTCLKKYGVDNYIKLIPRRIREESPTWKGGKKITPRNRQDYFYREWRKGVFERDKYTCQCCGANSTNTKGNYLVGHHIYNWKNFEDLRYSVDNGITLCLHCHHEFHKKYGVYNNNLKQIKEFIEHRRKDMLNKREKQSFEAWDKKPTR